SPGDERGYRYNDPAFGIQWPGEVRVISEKDRSWPDFQPARA
ncbi:MAG: dTDP-4-dehydrorhamnose 3,5-epimerase, partial [Verrucomicrobia bacterium]